MRFRVTARLHASDRSFGSIDIEIIEPTGPRHVRGFIIIPPAGAPPVAPAGFSMGSERVFSRGRTGPGEPESPQQIGTRYVNVIGNCSGLASATSAAMAAPAAPAATSTASAAATSTASAAYKAASASKAASTASAAEASAAASATPSKSFAELGRCGAFLVEDIKGCQADVRDFLFTESDFMTLRGVQRRGHIRRRPTGRRGYGPR
jgi:hypothetical protein